MALSEEGMQQVEQIVTNMLAARDKAKVFNAVKVTPAKVAPAKVAAKSAPVKEPEKKFTK